MVTVIMIFAIAAVLYMWYPGVYEKVARGFRSTLRERTDGIWEHNYIDCRVYYLYRYHRVPGTLFADTIEVTKALDYLMEHEKNNIIDIFQSCYLDRDSGEQQFNKTLVVMKNKMVVQLTSSYVNILHDNRRQAPAMSLLATLSTFRMPQKQEDFEINIITFSGDGLYLKPLEIKPTVLDLGLYYNDDFAPVDEVIRKRLGQQNDKGIVLLHGLPGTGKTTYLRHLVGTMNKKVLFVSPSVAGNLMNPEFLDLLIDNPNAVLIIEDAENIIRDRKYNSDSSVSNLLNLSDGLLSDCLNVQIICTFNSALSQVDSALMRKGRLIASYEFGKLSKQKAQCLSDHLGYTSIVEEDMTIAAIANQADKAYETTKTEVIGFRRQEVLMN